MSPLIKNRICTYRTNLIDLPDEIHAIIMATLDDLPTLQTLLISFPWLATVFLASFRGIISTILNRSLPDELRQYLYAIISARSAGPLETDQLGRIPRPPPRVEDRRG